MNSKIFKSLTTLGISSILANTIPAIGDDHQGNIWDFEPAPVSIGNQLIESDSYLEVPVNRATAFPLRSITGFEAVSITGETVTKDFDYQFEYPVVHITHSNSEKNAPPVMITLNGVSIDGEETVSFFVNEEYCFDHTFTFPKQADMPEKVAVAGEFNGWNDSAAIMESKDDGSLEITLSLKPGRYTYKYVIDGEWVSDPTNPETDGSSFNNSILRITDPNPQAPELHYISSRENGGGTYGGARSNQPIKSVTAILNNEVIANNAVTISEDRMSLGFNFNEDMMFGEDIVSVCVETESGAFVIDDYLLMKKSTPRTPRDEIIYFVMTDRFYDGDESNNPKPPKDGLHPSAVYKGGDWAGVSQKLDEDYFNKLGVTTLWLSPVTENTMNAEKDALPPHREFTSYHGYWPTSYTKPNPAFGTMDDLRDVVSSAHDKKIGVVFDFVANHVHEDHPMITSQPELATELQLETDAESEEENLNIRKFDAHPLTTWFDEFLPTLDYVNNPDARKVAVDAAMYWMQETNADGFRHDATKHIAISFWQELTEEVNSLSRSTGKRYYQVGETIGSRDTIMLNTGTDQLDGQFDFPLLFSFTPTFARGTSNFKQFADSIQESWDVYPRSAIMSPLIGNHDVSRFMAYAEEGDLPEGANEKEVGYENPPEVNDPLNYTKIEGAFALLMTLPGAPMMYYGDEVGMTGAHDPDNRRPFPWDNLSNEQIELRRVVAELTKLRQKSVALRRGNLEIVAAEENFLILERTSPEQSVALIMTYGNADESKEAADIRALIGTHYAGQSPKVVYSSNDQRKRHFRYALIELNP